MKTLDEVMAGVTLELPLCVKSYNVPIADTGDYESMIELLQANCKDVTAAWNEDLPIEVFNYLARAANSFPKLVEFVQGQPCYCVPGEPNQGQCPRCALLEECLK